MQCISNYLLLYPIIVFSSRPTRYFLNFKKTVFKTNVWKYVRVFLNTLIREESELIDKNFCFGFNNLFERKCSRLQVAASPK